MFPNTFLFLYLSFIAMQNLQDGSGMKPREYLDFAKWWTIHVAEGV